VEDGNLVVSRATDSRTDRAVHGLTRALLSNMVTGVSTGFTRTLIVEGVGYSGEIRGKDLVMRLGFSHEIVVTPPENISFEVEGRNPTTVRVKGIDKQVVGQVAADIRKLRPPEPYLGKGVRYSDEVIRRKVGKTGK
jgi:large subunit ribosomal protein L6